MKTHAAQFTETELPYSRSDQLQCRGELNKVRLELKRMKDQLWDACEKLQREPEAVDLVELSHLIAELHRAEWQRDGLEQALRYFQTRRPQPED